MKETSLFSIQQLPQKLKFQENPHSKSEWNIPLFILIILAIIGMSTISITFWNSTDYLEKQYSIYSTMMVIFAILGVVLTNFYHNKQFAILPLDYRVFQSDNVFYAFLLAIVIITIQLIYQITAQYLAFNIFWAINYTIFSSICEELLFRNGILGLFIYLSETFKNKIHLAFGLILSTAWVFLPIGVVFNSFMFASFHTNYANNLGLQIIVFISGILLSIAYIIRKDCTVNIFAHFFVNCFVALTMYLQFIGVMH